jgi:hypothetical protein
MVAQTPFLIWIRLLRHYSAVLLVHISVNVMKAYNCQAIQKKGDLHAREEKRQENSAKTKSRA